MTESNILSRGTKPYDKWDGEYPFYLVPAARNVWQGRAMQGDGAWESATGPEGSVGYITLDGLAQSLRWRVKGQHRPVSLFLWHNDAAGNPSAANVNVDYDYYDRALEEWVEVGADVMNDVSWRMEFGETYERQESQYRLILQGTATHTMKVSPYNQLLQEYQGKSRQTPGWPRGR